MIGNKIKIISNLKSFVCLSNFNQRNKYSIKRAIINVVSSSQFSLLKKENQYKVNNKNAQQYCLFYNRFGRCSRGSQCKLVHDPKRVTLCSRYHLSGPKSRI